MIQESVGAFTPSQEGADIFVPDGSRLEQALARTTHLAIGAHADDLEFFAWPGISACLDRADGWFTGIVVTDGAGSPRAGPYAGWSDARIVAERKLEQREAARIGRYSAVIQLSFPSAVAREPGDARVQGELHTLLSGMRPREAYLHNPADRHDTHVAVFLHSLAALRRLPAESRPGRAYGCEVWRDLDWLTGADRVELPAGDRPAVQAALNAVFQTQISAGKRYDLAVQGRRLAHATFGDSHEVDRHQGVILAMDLAPLLRDPDMDPLTFTLEKVHRLAADVRLRLERAGISRP